MSDIDSYLKDNELGLDHIFRKEYEQAEFYFVRAAGKCPISPIYHHNAGKACMEQIKLQDAEKHFRNAIIVDSNHAAAHYDLSLVLALQGKWEECFKEYEWRNECFSDLGYYRDMYSFGRKVLVCQIGYYRNFLLLPN